MATARQQPASTGRSAPGAHGRHDTPPALIRRIAERLLHGYQDQVAIRVGDELAWGEAETPCTLVVNDPGVVRELLLHPDLFRLVEAYLDGRLELEGDFETLLAVGEQLDLARPPLATRLELVRLALSLPKSKMKSKPPAIKKGHRARRNSQETISHHYDVGNDFYRLWLDPEMVYSCAYFASDDQPLEEAQRNKLDYLCRKLRLQPGQDLLDIGCGWGGLAVWAARHYGVRVHGITLSEQQYRHARRRVQEEGLQDQVTIELLDYRDLPNDVQYDRVVSVGMFEHVGLDNFPIYFGTVKRVLKPDGLYLNHGITSERDWSDTPETRFINHYIFPDGQLARIGTVALAMEEAGFEILDIESLRPHYALTLRHWVRNLERNREQAIRASSPKTYRLWRLYMAACAYNFDNGSIGIHQVLSCVRGNRRPLPLRRDDLYQ